MKVSVLVITHNEAVNLPACLAALSWCDDVVVLDSGSTDATVEIARSYGARVLHRPFDDFAAQRNFALADGDLRHAWVLHLDADEIVTPEFMRALEALEAPDGIDCYRVPSKLMLLGRWLRHAGMYPVYQVRLGHRDRMRFRMVGHGQQEDTPPARVGVFPEPYLHYSFSHGIRRWLHKHVAYAEDEARVLVAQRRGIPPAHFTGGEGDEMHRRRAAKRRAAKIPLILRAPARFFYVFVVRQGFRDGSAGLVYAAMLSVYEGMITAFAYEKLLGSSPIDVKSGRRVSAEPQARNRTGPSEAG